MHKKVVQQMRGHNKVFPKCNIYDDDVHTLLGFIQTNTDGGIE